MSEQTRDEADRQHTSTRAGGDENRGSAEGAVLETARAALDDSTEIAVYGLGKMGLPLAAVFADVTGSVIGVDIDPDVVETISAGECHVKREPGLADLVDQTVAEGALTATTSPAAAAERASVHVVIVPTTLTDDREPDLTTLEAATDAIGSGLEKGDLVLVECTVPPRTTVDRVRPALAETAALPPSAFGLAFCPERTSSGRALEDIRGAYSKVVGGVDGKSTRAARMIYEEINDAGVITVSDATTAECVKVFEGLYRDANIALANELATFTDEFSIDVREAIEVANTQPFCDIHDPGPGVGGHCIPFYPYFVIRPFETDAPMLRTARAVNDAMPRYTVEVLREILATESTDLSDCSIAVLGLTYRPGVEEIRASPSLSIVEELAESAETVYGVDPLLDSFEAFKQRGMEPIDREKLYDLSLDGIIVVTPHEEFESIRWSRLDREDGTLVVVDGRGSVDSEAVAAAGHRLMVIGSGEVTHSAGGGQARDERTDEAVGDESESGIERGGDTNV